MNFTLFIQNVLSILIPIGLPVLALLYLATEIGRWHDEHPDPPPEAFREEQH